MSTAGGTPHRIARAVGEHGEQVACDHVTGRGWQIVERNWRCRVGEVDIVAWDGGCLVFCEVKTRRSDRYGSPVEAVTPTKASRLRRLAWVWLQDHDVHPDTIRVDVIGVLLPRSGPARLTHLQAVA